jgi:uncharacterized protein with FMN-binding domain
MPSHRMHRGLVTLSASAVAAIYFAGYLRTQAADAALGATALPTPTTLEAVPTATPTTVVVQRSAPPTSRSAAPTPQPSPTPSAQSAPAVVAASYKDGTYTGTGTSRRGDVWVSVQIQGGQIANVTITRSTLQYPLRDIANLPSQVVQRQSAQVDIVTRATYSSMAFRGAVSQALASATSA